MTKTFDFNPFARTPRVEDEEKAYFRHQLTYGTVSMTIAGLVVWAVCLMAMI